MGVPVVGAGVVNATDSTRSPTALVVTVDAAAELGYVMAVKGGEAVDQAPVPTTLEAAM